jgi:hypothetical protein
MANKTRNAKSWVASTAVGSWLVIAGSSTLEAIGEYIIFISKNKPCSSKMSN